MDELSTEYSLTAAQKEKYSTILSAQQKDKYSDGGSVDASSDIDIDEEIDFDYFPPTMEELYKVDHTEPRGSNRRASAPARSTMSQITIESAVTASHEDRVIAVRTLIKGQFWNTLREVSESVNTARNNISQISFASYTSGVTAE